MSIKEFVAMLLVVVALTLGLYALALATLPDMLEEQQAVGWCRYVDEAGRERETLCAL